MKVSTAPKDPKKLMKLRTFLCHSLLAAATFAFVPHVIAQAAPTAIPIAPTVSPPPTPAAQKKIVALNMTPKTMKGAVAELIDALRSAQLPEINVLYAPGAAEVTVPELNLRNVSGAEALRLIATSGNCEAQPIPGDQNTIIGYMIRQIAAPSANPFQASVETRGGPTPPNPPAPRKPSSAGTSPRTSATLDFFDNPKGEFSRGVFNVSAEPTTAVRVYALGGITTRAKFTDVEATLREVLKADGIAADTAKFALHEKTNVLVVTGSNRVHELVLQLVEALRKNHADAEKGNELRQNAIREVTEMQIRLGGEQEQKARLAEQLAKAEDQKMKFSDELAKTSAELRALNQELARLKASTAKPSN